MAKRAKVPVSENVIRLRREGHTYQSIGKLLGCSKKEAHALVLEAIRRVRAGESSYLEEASSRFRSEDFERNTGMTDARETMRRWLADALCGHLDRGEFTVAEMRLALDEAEARHKRERAPVFDIRRNDRGRT